MNATSGDLLANYLSGDELQTSNRELTEALEQQTATAEILRVISQSPADAQPVFDTIVRNAVRLSGAAWATVRRVEGGFLHLVAHHNLDADVLGRFGHIWPHPVAAQSPTSRVARTGQVFRSADVEVEAGGLSPEALEDYQARGIRSLLVVPMLRDGRVVGTINLTHQAVGAFSDAHVALIRTFADQAVIAIENVRLFTELQEKNRALTDAHAQVTEALEQQTATSEILRVISTSPTNLQPVLDEVVNSAARFCGAPDASIFRLDGGNLRAEAHHGLVAQPMWLVPLVRGTVAGRSVLERQAVGVTDLQGETDEYPEGSALARQTGQRATLSVPLMREGAPIGVILLRRAEAVPFTDKQIALLKTFADQAVIAIENVRLFKELEARTAQLLRSVTN